MEQSFHAKEAKPTRIDQPGDFRTHARSIADRINSDPALGVLLLVDPVQVLEEIGYELGDEVKKGARRSMLGITRAQSGAYQVIKEKLRRGESVSGIQSVRVRPRGPSASRATDASPGAETSLPPVITNPLGGHDMVLDLAEKTAERIAQLAYDEGIFPHRLSRPELALIGAQEIILGRPTSVSFDTAVPNGVRLDLPFALTKSSGVTQGKVSLDAVVKTAETAGKPEYLVASIEEIASLELGGEVMDEAQRNYFESLLKPQPQDNAGANGNTIRIPLSPLFAELSKIPGATKLDLSVEDLAIKVHNLPDPLAEDSVAMCLNFAPNDGAGDPQQVGQFVKQHWALGASERILQQKLEALWNDPQFEKFKRLSKTNLEEQKFDQIFDPNGSIVITKIQFSCEAGFLNVVADVTAENEFLWIDADVNVSAKVMLTVDPLTHQLQVVILEVDSSISCWTRFLIGLFCGLLGFVAGAIVGGLIGAVVGGIVGGIVAASAVTIGVVVGGSLALVVAELITQVVMPAIVQAALKKKIEGQSIDLLPIQFDWQIPETDLILKASGLWAEVVPGEILLGGKLDTPPLSGSAVSIQEKGRMREEVEVALPWNSAEPGGKGPGSGGNYFVNSTITCCVLPMKLMERPLSGQWSVDGQQIAGEGEEIEISVTPCLDVQWKPVQKGTGSVWQPVHCIRIQKSIRVLLKDGTKGAPHITSYYVDGPVWQVGDQSTLEVTATDALGNTAEAIYTIGAQVLGDCWIDVMSAWTEANLHRYESRVPPEELLPPVPASKVLVREKGLPPGVSELSFRRPLLAGLISGAVDLRDKALG